MDRKKFWTFDDWVALAFGVGIAVSVWGAVFVGAVVHRIVW